MSERYFRVQSPGRDINNLLDPEYQFSYAWGRDEDGPLTRHGVSVCDSREALAAYLAGTGIPFADMVLVELEGELSDDEPVDAHLGEYLIHPTRIVSVAPMDDEFCALIDAAYDAIEADNNRDLYA